MLEIRELDIGDHSPLEAADETCFEPWDLRWPSVAGEHDLPASLVQRVEGVKELFLCRFLPLEKLHVVDEEEIGLAEAPAELLRGSILDRRDELVSELLGANEGDARVGLAVEELVRDGLHEVGFADAGVAVNEERVVDAAWRLCDGVRGCCCELVRLSDDEVAESVSIA